MACFFPAAISHTNLTWHLASKVRAEALLCHTLSTQWFFFSLTKKGIQQMGSIHKGKSQFLISNQCRSSPAYFLFFDVGQASSRELIQHEWTTLCMLEREWESPHSWQLNPFSDLLPTSKEEWMFICFPLSRRSHGTLSKGWIILVWEQTSQFFFPFAQLEIGPRLISSCLSASVLPFLSLDFFDIIISVVSPGQSALFTPALV